SSAGGFRGAGCAPGLFFDLVFPHAASAAGDRRRWVDGSAHVAGAVDQLDGISLFCISGVLVAIPPGSAAPRDRRSARDGIAGRDRRSAVQGQPSAQPEFTMNAIKFLFAAYIATWVIHGVYLGTLVRRFSRLRQQLKEVKAPGFRRSAPGFPPQV